jgi:hypothetical protein
MSVIQWFSFVVAIVMITTSIRRSILTPEKMFIRFPIIFLGLHILLFYTYVFFNSLGWFPNDTFLGVLKSGDWSAIVRLHSILTILLLEIYGYMRDKTWKIMRP